MTDLIFAALLSVALLVVSLTNHRRILRAEAGLLLTVYILYLTWRVATV
jgi:Ca2+/Na+ antiporter